MRDLLHPPPHRGPLIASGALVLTVGVALLQVRMGWSVGVQLLIAVVLAVTLLWLGLQAPSEGGAPYPHQSVLLVLGLAAFGGVLVRLIDLVGDLRSPSSGTLVWTSLLECGLAVFVSVRRRSAIAALIAAVAGGASLLAAWDWVVDPRSVTPYRWLLLLLAFVFGLASLALRGESGRHADQMVNAAGSSILLIGLSGAFGFGDLPPGWELVVFVAGVSLAAYAAADRAPGAAYLSAANLAAFIAAAAGDGDVVGWPLLLLVVGSVMLLAGLRPRRPLPPEPDASTRPDDMPLTVRVHRD